MNAFSELDWRVSEAFVAAVQHSMGGGGCEQWHDAQHTFVRPCLCLLEALQQLAAYPVPGLYSPLFNDTQHATRNTHPRHTRPT
jgi:hypothetical protein